MEINTREYVERLANTVAKTINDAFENITIEDVDMFKLGYNKGINDFTDKFLLELSESVIWGMLIECYKNNNSDSATSTKIVDYVVDTVKEVSEQLKGGENNDN